MTDKFFNMGIKLAGKSKLCEPVFYEIGNYSEKQLKSLEAIRPTLNYEGQKILDNDIKYIRYGIAGEKNIAYELKNSHMPMYVLHDVTLAHNGITAQIDFIVITRLITFFIECKNLYGDIEINEKGDFIRTLDYFGHKKREGIYSPVTQNQRHLELYRKLRNDKLTGIYKLSNKLCFDIFYKSVVVLANPKTVLDDSKAPKDIKDKVIRIDRLIEYIKQQNSKCKEIISTDIEMFDAAERFKKLNFELNPDYTKKHDKYRINISKQTQQISSSSQKSPEVKENIEDTPIYKELKAYRRKKANEEHVSAFCIFYNRDLMEIINKLPITHEELKKCHGFGDVKVKKYGNDIINIVKKYK